jgi:Fe-S cluster assembly iron-binding protein IscA
MLKITDTAVKHVCKALLDDHADKSLCLRIVFAEEGVGFLLDERQPGDFTLEYEDRVVLIVDAQTAELLDNRRIDYDAATSKLLIS